MCVKYIVKLNIFLKNILTRILLYNVHILGGKKLGDSCLIYGIYARAARKRDWRLWTFLFFRKKCEKESFCYFSLGQIAPLKGDFCIYLYYAKKSGERGKKEGGGCGCDL